MKDMIADLNERGIHLKQYNVGSHKTTCPRCSLSRKNKKDPCLWVNITEPNLALWKCHNCEWRGAAGDVTKGNNEPMERKRTYTKPAVKVPQESTLPPVVVKYLESRAITMEVATRNKLYYDAEKNALAFPYFVKGELTNVKYRGVAEKKFFMEKGAKLTFYGLDDITGNDQIIICEGEFDRLALEVCGLTNVLSVPNGAPAKIKEGEEIDNSGQFEYLQHSMDLFKNVKRVVLAVDMDPAGEVLRYELARRIGLAKCFIAKFPVKDANDCLMQLGVDTTLDCINNAEPYPIKGLHTVDDMHDDLVKYYEEGMAAGVPTGFSNLDKLYTVMPGEVTVITGIPNAGKSEFMDALMINLAKNEGWKFAVFSPEGVKEQHIAQLVEKVVGAPSAPHAPNRMSVEQFMNGASWVAKYFYFIRADDENSLPTLDYVLEKASAAVYRYGVNGFLLDPWNELEHSRPQNVTDTEYVGKALAQICRWAKNRKVKVFIVAHPTKISADKDGKMRVPGLYDILGSSNWANKVDNGLVIHRSEDASDATEVFVKKARSKFVGRRGSCQLLYDKETGQYSVPKTDKDFPNYKSDDPDIMSWP